MNTGNFTTLVFATAFLLGSAVSAAGENAHDYATQAGRETIQGIKEAQVRHADNPAGFLQRIEELLTPLIDFSTVSRLVMSRHYKTATAEQRERFVTSFKRALLDKYGGALNGLGDETIEVLPATKPPAKPNLVTVGFEVVTSNSRIPGSFVLRRTGSDEWRLVNVIISGINIGLAFRSQFAAAMIKYNNDLDQVIDNWESSI